MWHRRDRELQILTKTWGYVNNELCTQICEHIPSSISSYCKKHKRIHDKQKSLTLHTQEHGDNTKK